MNDLNPDAFEVILDYIYTGVLSINGSNIDEILKMSDFLQLKWAKEECCQYLKKNLIVENALEIWELTRKYFCDKLQNEVNIFILESFKDVIETEKYKKLDIEKLNEILQNDQMISTRADIVFTAIVEWVKYDLPNRRTNLEALLKFVKTESISKRCYESIIFTEPILREDPLVVNWMLDHFSNNFSLLKQDVVNNSVRNSVNENIFICCLTSDLKCYKYNTKPDEFTLLKKERPLLSSYYPVFYKENIYLTCGEVEGVLSEFCPKYDVGTKSWSRIKFQSDRIRNGSCVLNDKMYIIGGKWKEEFKNDIKMYDFETGQLIPLDQKLIRARGLFGIGVHNQSAYVCGGERIVNSKLSMNSGVERFDHREGKVSTIPRIPNFYGSCTSAVISDSLFCSKSDTGIVAEFDIRRNSWTVLSNINKSNCLISSGGHLYAITSDGILQLDRNNNKWEVVHSQAFYDKNIFGVSF